jgi:predicted SAM-dependent methyltransferase
VEELKSLGVSVFALNIERDALPFEDGSVDIVIANQILEHTKELFWIFHQVSRVLPVGGQFIVGVPNLRCTIEFFSRADGSRHR